MTEPSTTPATAPAQELPAAAPPQQNLPATETPTSPQSTLKQRLDAAEHLWIWKFSIRLILSILALIGLGAFAWAFSTSSSRANYDTFYAITYGDKYALPWTLITFGITIIFNTTVMLVLLLTKPNKPAHPGLAVAFDLLLWLAYIVTAMFALMGLMSVMEFGQYGSIGYGGEAYIQADNGTWVYNPPNEHSYYYNDGPRDCSTPNRYGSLSYAGFKNCEEQDAYVNSLWDAKSHRVAVETMGVACQFICLIGHLALFIWACVDCSRYNRSKGAKDAEKLAGEIVERMIRNGTVVPGNGSVAMQQPLLAHVQPQGQGQWGGQQMQMQQMPQQGWGQQMPQGWGPQQGMQQPQPVVMGPEKGESSRFA